MKVAKWGNSLAVRLPAAVVEALELKEGDDLTIHAVDRTTVGMERQPTRKELIERLHKFHGLLPADFKFDREEANARCRASLLRHQRSDLPAVAPCGEVASS